MRPPLIHLADPTRRGRSYCGHTVQQVNRVRYWAPSDKVRIRLVNCRRCKPAAVALMEQQRRRML